MILQFVYFFSKKSPNKITGGGAKSQEYKITDNLSYHVH